MNIRIKSLQGGQSQPAITTIQITVSGPSTETERPSLDQLNVDVEISTGSSFPVEVTLNPGEPRQSESLSVNIQSALSKPNVQVVVRAGSSGTKAVEESLSSLPLGSPFLEKTPIAEPVAPTRPGCVSAERDSSPSKEAEPKCELSERGVGSASVPVSSGPSSHQLWDVITHKDIRDRLRREANALDFVTSIRWQRGRKFMYDDVDLTLRKGSLFIGVEISLRTTIDQTVRHAKKCLSDGFSHLAVVSPNPERLNLIAQSVKAELPEDEASKIGYYTPDDFVVEMRKFKVQVEKEPIPQPTERIVGGYRVRRVYPKLTEEERRLKEDLIMKTIIEILKETS